jgi:hypothetical protein
VDRSGLIATYWEHYRLSTSDVREDRLRSAELAWACDDVEATVETDRVAALELLGDLATAAPDERALSYLGAGPVEQALRGADAEAVSAVDALARRNQHFRTALRSAWFDDQLDPGDRARLRRLAPPR